MLGDSILYWQTEIQAVAYSDAWSVDYCYHYCREAISQSVSLWIAKDLSWIEITAGLHWKQPSSKL